MRGSSALLQGLAVGVAAAAAFVAAHAAYARRARAAPEDALAEDDATEDAAECEPAVRMIRDHVSKKHPQGLAVELVMLDDVRIESVFMFEVAHLSAYAPKAGRRNKMDLGKDDGGYSREYNQLLGAQDAILQDIVRSPGGDTISTAFLRAGPRSELHFEPSRVRAAIVTAGGLCPGLNNIIQGLVRTLISLYGVEKVYGVRGGYGGFAEAPIELTLERVVGLQNKGGTMIGSGRGSFDLAKTIGFLKQHRISQLYVVGGDGTHRAANKIADEARRLKLNIAVCGVPKTIDNDIDLLDRSFGFSTAVEEAQAAILSAQTEARCNLPNGIGIVKLMGRHSGFIAVHATMCSGEVDLCLVPEVPVVTEGPLGILPHLERVLERKGHAVIVVAEGAGEEIFGTSAVLDAGGNRKLPELGLWLKDQIVAYMQARGKVATVKYVDPSYMIRSVPANASDSIYCELLAQNVVHGAMAGYTAFSVGMRNNRLVYIPINAMVKKSPRQMDAHGQTWERVLSITRQPNTVPPKEAKAPQAPAPPP
mmetsp:Transcript_9624/g.22476  ORF Transcript_9624/g.22476 Transcript_9624/m.22476 type:complete len:536 (+) Transcript_9624:49-1656(+)